VNRRIVVLLGVAAAVVVVAAGGVYAWHRLATGGKVTEVGVAEALDRYRDQVGATTTGPPATTVPPTTEVHTVTTAAPTPEVHTVTTTTTPVVHSLVAPGV
jgi:hypothetical protein